MITVKDVYDFLNSKAPFNTAAEWDNTGLSVGSLSAPVSSVLVALDVTKELIEYAEKNGFGLVVTHHPLIFNPLKSVEKCSVVYAAVSSGITFVSSHTCLDKASGGVNDTLGGLFSLEDIYTSEHDEFLKIGYLKNAVSPDEFAKTVRDTLGGAVRYNSEGLIKKIAFCSGSGGDCIHAAALENADALLTGDAAHHEFLEAHERGVSLFAAGHFETENPIAAVLCESIKEKFNGALKVEVFTPEKLIQTIV